MPVCKVVAAAVALHRSSYAAGTVCVAKCNDGRCMSRDCKCHSENERCVEGFEEHCMRKWVSRFESASNSNSKCLFIRLDFCLQHAVDPNSMSMVLGMTMIGIHKSYPQGVRSSFAAVTLVICEPKRVVFDPYNHYVMKKWRSYSDSLQIAL